MQSSSAKSSNKKPQQEQQVSTTTPNRQSAPSDLYSVKRDGSLEKRQEPDEANKESNSKQESCQDDTAGQPMVDEPVEPGADLIDDEPGGLIEESDDDNCSLTLLTDSASSSRADGDDGAAQGTASLPDSIGDDDLDVSDDESSEDLVLLDEEDDDELEDDDDDDDLDQGEDEKNRQLEGNLLDDGSSRRRRRERRSSGYSGLRRFSCQCDHLINKIDYDGLPVTDVDLVSYKELCQMEQQAHHLARSRNQQNQLINCFFDTRSISKNCHLHQFKAKHANINKAGRQNLLMHNNSVASIRSSTFGLTRNNASTATHTGSTTCINNLTESNYHLNKAHRGSCSMSIAPIINKQQTTTSSTRAKSIIAATKTFARKKQQQAAPQSTNTTNENNNNNKRRPSYSATINNINRLDSASMINVPVTKTTLMISDSSSMMLSASHRNASASTALLQTSGGPGGGSMVSHTTLVRRSSLQEESGAYYELCIPPEEQLISAKYSWFPRSLAKSGGLALVDQFFASFPKHKIPYASIAAATDDLSSSPQATNTNQNKQLTQATISSSVATRCARARSASASGGTGAPPPVHPAASSYRDEQISYQLARQDISLDYCSYPMSPKSKNLYAEFIDKRNSQCLDVARVIQIRRPNQQQRHHAANRQTSLAPATASSAAQLNPSGTSNNAGDHQSSSAPNRASLLVSERCRRCLVRFEEFQVAVAAPNFIIGSPAFRNQQLNEHELHSSLPMSPYAHSSTSCLLGSNVALFHPQCFTCATCKQFLVDLVYCLRDQKLYCFRHYGDSLRPRCNWCQELIFSDDYLKALNGNFHVDHFLCHHCDINLAGQRYVLRDRKSLCIECYEKQSAHSCERCQKPIGIDSSDLSYRDKHWHDTCFSCETCQQSLIERPFGCEADKIYCANCYNSSFALRCDGCKNPFRAGSKKMEYRGQQWHDSCFCCCVCKNTIGSNSFIPKNDEIYCIKCYEDKYATRCTKCRLVIVSGGITFRNQPWHRDCFNCCHCQKSLAGQRFTTRDANKQQQQSGSSASTSSSLDETSDNQKTSAKFTKESREQSQHNAYCIECYGELFAKKCHSCKQAIIGLGGTRFVTFEDRSWHNDCFICHDCQSSLVGKGFITDGPDTILCGDCARAKLR